MTDPPNDSTTGPNVASLKAECGAKFSWAKSPGFVFWSKHYFVLKNGDTTLYEFKTDLVSIRWAKQISTCKKYRIYFRVINFCLQIVSRTFHSHYERQILSSGIDIVLKVATSVLS